ncbi:MAG: ABC transporter permease [Eubacteriales bacterium]
MTMFMMFLIAAVGAGIPLLFGTVGEIFTEKTGHLNLGVEGMMSIGACAGFMFGYFTDSFIIAIITAAIAGAMSAAIYALLTVTFMANQNVTGLTLTIFGVGLANLIGVMMLEYSPEGTLKLPAGISATLLGVNIPILSDIPILGDLLFSYTPFVYIGILIAVAGSFFLSYTKTGLNIQSVGENPAAADAAGINVTKWKYFNIILGGAICGIGGAYCSMVINGGVWISDNVGGLGWISVALVILANWKPVNAIWGSLVFGGLRVLKYYVPKSIFPFPNAFYDMLPFLITALVLIVSSMGKSKKMNLPASLGTSYYREER